MSHHLTPAIWLIVLIVGLPQLSETVYTPSLPDIARSLQTTESWVEYTLTAYLFGFAAGTFFWGYLSDRFGRKPCVIAGLSIFILGCLGCYLSPSVGFLIFSRLIQAFGGSIGSVLGQAICRDAFQGAALSKIYASVGMALALFPALGPILGGLMAEYLGWPTIFIFLLCFALSVIFLVFLRLPETHQSLKAQTIPLSTLIMALIRDKRILGFGLIVAICNGIMFSYFAEAPFYLIKTLGLSPTQYGLSFILIAAASILGSFLAKRLHVSHHPMAILGYGLRVMVVTAAFFSLATMIEVRSLNSSWMIAITVFSQMSMALGICLALPNALASALVDYKQAIGTASSLFGLFYYSLISLLTLGMGFLHNGSLLVMPLYFLALSLSMLWIKKGLLS